MIKIAINGFGRIGRLAFRKVFADDRYEAVSYTHLDVYKRQVWGGIMDMRG